MNASSSAGVPQAASSSTSPARSTSSISGERCARSAAVLDLAPEPVAGAGFDATRAPGALFGRCPAGRHGRQPTHARCRCRIVGARARPESTTTRTPSTVSDVSAMSVDSTTRRRPAGDGASARSWSPSERAPASGYTSTSARRPGRAQPSVRLISPMPGQEHEHVAGLFVAVPRSTAAAVAASMPVCVCLAWQPAASRPGYIRPSLSITGASSSTATSPAVSGVADIAMIRRSGRIVPATSVSKRQPRSVGRLRSWTSSKITRPTPGNSGSFCSRRVRMPSVTTSIRVSRPMWRSSRV